MTDELRFEVRPIEGAFAAVGETVSFRREGGKLYALNEDGEAFGVVPSKFAAAICDQPAETLTAEVAGRGEGGFLTVQVAFEEAGEEPAVSPAAAPAGQAAPSLAKAPAPTPAAPAVPAAGEATSQIPVAEAPNETGTAAEPAAGEEARAPQSKRRLPVWAKVAVGILAAVVVLLVVLVGVVLIGTEATQTVTVGHVSYEAPGSWTAKVLDVDEDDLNEYYYGVYADDFDGGILIQADCPSDPYFTEYALPYLLSGMGIDDDPIDEYTTDEGARVYLYEGLEIEGESQEGTGYLQVVVSGDYATTTYAYCTPAEFDEHADELLEILNTLTIIDAEEPSYSQTQTIGAGDVTTEIPVSWTVEEDADNTTAYSDDYTCLIEVSNGEEITDWEELYLLTAWVWESYDGDADVERVDYEDAVILKISVSSYEFDYHDVDDVDSIGYLYYIFSGNTYYLVRAFCSTDDYGLYGPGFEGIVASLNIDNPSEPYDAEDAGDEDGEAST